MRKNGPGQSSRFFACIRLGAWPLVMMLLLSQSGTAQSKKISASGISPYWLKKPLPNTLTVLGEATDSLEAQTEAFRAARAQIIGQLVQRHEVRMNDSLLSLQDYQYHYRAYLLQQTVLNQWTGLQIMGIPLDSQRIRSTYVEFRRDKARGRNFYRHYLNIHWHDSLYQQLSDDFYAYDIAFSETIQSAAYYLQHPTDLDLLQFMKERLQPVTSLLTDYRAQKATELLQAYAQMYRQTHIKIDSVSATDFRISLLAANRHMYGSKYVPEIYNCVKVYFLTEKESGFHFSYDESLCTTSPNYPVCIRLLLPDSSERSIEIPLPGNRVNLKAKSPITLHYFQESQDGYAEMTLVSVSGQDYYIRELHFAGLRFDLSMNGRGRSIRGAGQYLLRAPISNEQFKQLLRLKSATVTGGFIYTHPSSGLPMDACFEDIGIQLKKHKN